MEQKRIERQTLWVIFSVNILLAVSACWTYVSTGIQAIFLDAGFSILLVMSTVAALVISKISGTTSRRFPEGRYWFEPLYALLKAIINLTLLLIVTITSAQRLLAFAYNAPIHKLNIIPVFPYILLLAVMCFGSSTYAKYQNRKIQGSSTILTADSKIAFVDGLMASGVALGVFLLLFIKESSPLSFLLYIGDALISLILVVVAVKNPINLFRENFFELVGGTLHDNGLNREIRKIVNRNIPPDVQLKECHIRKKGMSYQVTASLHYRSTFVDLEQLRQSIMLIKKELSSQCTVLNLHMNVV